MSHTHTRAQWRAKMEHCSTSMTVWVCFETTEWNCLSNYWASGQLEWMTSIVNDEPAHIFIQVLYTRSVNQPEVKLRAWKKSSNSIRRANKRNSFAWNTANFRAERAHKIPFFGTWKFTSVFSRHWWRYFLYSAQFQMLREILLHALLFIYIYIYL